MSLIGRRWPTAVALACLAGLVCLLAAGPEPVHAQHRGGLLPHWFPPSYYQQYGYTPWQVRNTYAAMGYRPGGFLLPGYGFGYNSSYWWNMYRPWAPIVYPYYPYYPYYPPGWWGYYPPVTYNFTYNPSDYLQGAAAVYNAQGAFLVKQAEAQRLQAEAEAIRLENRRRAAEQALREKQNRLTPEQIRARDLEMAYRRSLADPPTSQIISGQALNDLLLGLNQRLASAQNVPEVPLNQSELRQVAVASANDRVNVSLLLTDKLPWPDLLRGPSQEKLDKLIPEAVQSVRSKGSVDSALYASIEGELEKLGDHLDSQVNSGEITPNQHIQANRFLNALRRAVTILRRPNAADYLNGLISARGDTVPQLVKYMMTNNLRFAPAIAGQEEAYVDLHRAMVAQAMQLELSPALGSVSGFRVRLGPNLPNPDQNEPRR
ncbi:MAG: hypothetical protein NZM31_12215 [Gemmatales bacterium]|nr:hypothetical protein [Gemmatales bacterium]MDW8387759.1 hypothetical protein [Gemmatales bacterium]